MATIGMYGTGWPCHMGAPYMWLPPPHSSWYLARLTDSLDHPCHAAFFFFLGLLSSSIILLRIAGIGVHRLYFQIPSINLSNLISFFVDAALFGYNTVPSLDTLDT